MNISTHFIVSSTLAVFLYPLFGWSVLLIFVLGFLIDVDHYWWHIFKDGKMSLIEAYNIDKDKSVKQVDLLHVFHVFEFWLPVALLGFLNDLFFILAFGMVVHLLLDFIHMIYVEAEHARTLSIISWLWRNS